MGRGRPAPVVIFCVMLSLVLCVLALAGCGEKKEEAPAGNSGTSGTTGTGVGDAAQVASCQANLRTIDSAIAQYESATGKKASSLQALVPTYLRSIPQEPTGGTYSISGGKAVCSKGHK